MEMIVAAESGTRVRFGKSKQTHAVLAWCVADYKPEGQYRRTVAHPVIAGVWHHEAEWVWCRPGTEVWLAPAKVLA